MKKKSQSEDTEDGQTKVDEERTLSSGDTEKTITQSSALTDAMIEVLDQIPEIE